jgi:RNA polymerase sigma-70 factor (ECF subfamily)
MAEPIRREAEADEGARAAIEAVFRANHGQILGVLTRDLRDLDLAEEGLQEAFAEALRTWPSRGRPGNPAGWIVTTARNRAIDRLRRAATGRDKLERHAAGEARPDQIADPVLERLLEDEEIPDERLRLIFTCCHPALTGRDAVALTLRTVAGLSSGEIAAAFLVKETTLQARITRAKAKIRQAGLPFRVPEHHELPERLPPVLDVITLVYNEGYTPRADSPVRDRLRREAIGLAAMVSEHLPDEPEALGCQALLLFHETRAPARVGADGELVALEDQDRTLWDHDQARRADELLRRALRLGRPGPLQLQAAISGIHSTSPSATATDWREVALLYDHLLALTPSPTVEVGRAVAVGMADGPEAGLAALPAPDPPLDTFHRWHAARGDLLHRAGRTEEAARALTRAAALATNPAERRWLERRARDGGAGHGDGSRP